MKVGRKKSCWKKGRRIQGTEKRKNREDKKVEQKELQRQQKQIGRRKTSTPTSWNI